MCQLLQGCCFALCNESEMVLLFQTITHPQPSLKRRVCAIAYWERGSATKRDIISRHRDASH